MFAAATYTLLSCSAVTPGNYTFDWLGYCTHTEGGGGGVGVGGGEDEWDLVFTYAGFSVAMETLKVLSTPLECLDLIVCRATDDLGCVAEARFWNNNVTGNYVFNN